MSRDLDRRLAALARAAELADGRLEPAGVAAARDVARRAGERLGLDLEATVVALAGPTGAGKSTLFNALAGVDLAVASARRPTTAQATAVTWGEPPGALLDWLDVRLRHPAPADPARNGLVLLDLPDFDSVERAHRLEVDRLVALGDLLVWVVDPQKYADAALHDGYLRRLGDHGSAMLVVLNQVDLLAPDGERACLRDLQGLLAADGLPDLPVLAVSARTGRGLDELGRLLERRVAERGAALARLAGDVTTAARGLDAGCGTGRPAAVTRRDRAQLVHALGDAAGVPTVVDAVGRSHRREGALATGWPLVRWVGRLRPDPLRRLRLGGRPDETSRPSLPAPTSVQRSVASSALRTLAVTASGTLPDPWPRLVRDAAIRHEAELPDRLDRAIAGAEVTPGALAGGARPARSSRSSLSSPSSAPSGSSPSPCSAISAWTTSCRCPTGTASRCPPSSCSAASSSASPSRAPAAWSTARRPAGAQRARGGRSTPAWSGSPTTSSCARSPKSSGRGRSSARRSGRRGRRAGGGAGGGEGAGRRRPSRSAAPSAPALAPVAPSARRQRSED